ncbi:mucin-17 [Takifugu rubripes]|uniref:Mucin-17 n=2 Tax=Tetraodontidae TaxID=31031 RepID=A0A674MRH2_TAKRU|nr:mucin-17 [Takifugu rubripes]XP_011604144.2 mucin-17 [Takifugu rubripes]XP_029694490.1 mucin-17 [Takifugu rubripes]XP_029694491.1 mucin-17 [Takifugu rubripes]XP_029694492.1 mucin-17 [Takifugu rubripes]
MDSHLASVLISGSLNVQNGSRCAEGPELVAEVSLESRGRSSPCSAPGNPQPCPVKAAVAIRRDALSITGKKPEVGGTCKPASQEESDIGGLKQPIAANPGVPVLCGRPIRLRCVVPPQRSRPITNSAISRTKDFPRSAFSSVGTLAQKNRNNIHICADGDEEERKEKHDSVKHELFRQAGRREKRPVKTDALNNKVSAHELETSFISSHSPVKLLSPQGIKEEMTEGSILETPLPQQEVDFQPCETSEEQTEPLDLSLPRKKERRGGRILDDSGCESLLIMEVDEYEGEGDRDTVEEDDEAVLRTDSTPQDALLSPFFSTSPAEEDTENLLLIDEQGIPYTLTPDGLKVPQVDVSGSEDPRPERDDSAEDEGRHSPSSAEHDLSQSLDTLAPPAEDHSSSPLPGTDTGSAPADAGQTQAPELFAITSCGPSQAAEPSFQSAQSHAVPCPPSGISAPSQPIQIFPNPPANAPLVFLSSPSSSLLSSAPLGLTLPITVNQSASCSPTPMFLLLSSVPSSSGETTSTPIAVLDPSTGQLSKIDTASVPVSLPLPSSEVSDLSSPLPTISHPVIRLTPNNPPVIIPGVPNVSAGSVFTSFPPPPPPPALQNKLQSGSDVPLPSESNSSIPNSGCKAIVGGDAEEVSHISNEPLPSTASPPHASDGQSPATEPQFDFSGVHTQHLPLDDHLYFSNPAASPSPPAAPVLSPGKLNALDPLDPGSPSNMGPRRVLYCQLCPRVFFYLSDLERHAITHSQKKPHVCQQCGKAFKRSSHLQRHKHIHTGQRNFVCSICAKRFREAGELQRHQRVHTGEKPYQCQLCHTRFAERNTLRRHTKRKHPYHQVAMEMLNEGKGSVRGNEGGVLGMLEEEESAEWYSSTVSNLENSESEGES